MAFLMFGCGVIVAEGSTPLNLTNGTSLLTNIPSAVVPSSNTIVLTKYFNGAVLTNAVLVNSSLGKFCLQLFPTNAPNTVANFLRYVNAGSYKDLVINRSVPNWVIQAGGYNLRYGTNGSPYINPVTPFTNVLVSEAGISNTVGTVAMALSTGSNSATCEWFINLSNNATSLDGTNNGGPFTVFAKVMGSGMSNVVNPIAALPNYDESGSFGAAWSDTPLRNYAAGAGIQIPNLVMIENITPSTVPYYVVNSDTNHFSTQINGTNLVVKYKGLVGKILENPATITAYAADSNGNVVEKSFQVVNQKIYQSIYFPVNYVNYSTNSFNFPNYPTASSGLGVSVQIKSGPAKIANGRIVLTGPGVVIMIANQPGNAVYNAAPAATGYLIIN